MSDPLKPEPLYREPLKPEPLYREPLKPEPLKPEPLYPDRHGATLIPRRSLLVAAASGLGLGLLGCRDERDVSPEPQSPRQDIPLRVVWFGEADEFEIVRRAWAAVSPLPLAVTAITAERQDPAGFEQPFLEAAGRSDVLIYPLIGVAELFAEGRLTPLIRESSDEDARVQGGPPPALRNAASEYAGVEVTIPLGTRQPALVTVDSEFRSGSWREYDAWVAQVEGAAAEPLSRGWAAAMFLHRAASSLDTGWLFEREGLEPLIASDPYVEVLEQMRRTAARYRLRRSSPVEIWSKIRSGELRGGIGFPAGPDRNVGAAMFADPPSNLSVQRVLLDAFSAVGSVTSVCRQTAASKRFLQWLAGGPGSESVQREIERMTMPSRQQSSAPGGTSGTPDDYQLWLRDHLQTAVTLPTLQLLSSGDYYASLDDQLVRCLEGELTPAIALATAADRWRQITEDVGPERQQRAWRRAQGMIG